MVVLFVYFVAPIPKNCSYKELEEQSLVVVVIAFFR
jgi:hypothetical protein